MTARQLVSSLGLASAVVAFAGTPLPAASIQPATPAASAQGAPAATASVRPASPIAPRPAEIIVPAPAALVVPPPSYARKGRRDPFIPIVPEVPEDPPGISARLTGIVRGHVTRALLETPDGVGYVLQLGDTLGPGRLIEIGADRVVFTVADRRGARLHRVVLRLPSE